MSNSKPFSLKLQLGSDIRRFSLEEVSFETLRSVVRASYPHLKHASFVLKYVDEENEWITCASDADLYEALKISQSQKLLPKFKIEATESLASAFPCSSAVPVLSAASTSDGADGASSSAAPSALPSLAELTKLAQEFLFSSYSRANLILEKELPAFINAMLTDSVLTSTATVRSVLDAGETEFG